MDNDLPLLNNLLISQHFLTVDEESEAQDRLRLLARGAIGSNEDHIWVVRNRRRRQRSRGLTSFQTLE